MNFDLTETQDAIRELSQRIFGDLATHERLKEVEAGSDRHDPKLWDELAKAGLLGIGLPEPYGEGHGFLEECVLLIEQGRAVAPVPLWPTLTAARAISTWGTDEQKERWLSGVASGEVILTVSFHDGMFVPYAHLADAIVAVRDDVRIVTDFEAERLETTSGIPEFTVELHEGVPLAADPGPLREHATVGLCALAVGVATQALRMTSTYTSEREQFDRPLGTFQAVQQRAADAYIDTQAIRWTMWQAAWRLSEGLDATDSVRVAKHWASDGVQRVVSAAQHLHGGIGVDTDYPLYRYTLWAKHLELALGSGTPQLAEIGRDMADGTWRPPE